MRLPRALSPRDHGSPWGLFAWEQVEQVKPLTGRRHCCAQCAHRTAAGKDERTDMGKPRSTVPCAPGRGCRTRPLQPPCSGRSASPPQGRQQTVTTTQGRRPRGQRQWQSWSLSLCLIMQVSSPDQQRRESWKCRFLGPLQTH